MTNPQSVLSSSESGLLSIPRENRSFTAVIEKRALEWIALGMPRWVTSDQLTALGFVSQIAAGVFYASARFHRDALLFACVCIALNWFGDSMDGTLARVRRQQRPRYGFYVDHMVDILGSAALMVGMACSGLVHSEIALAMLVTFLILASESYLATHTLGSFQMSQGLFGPTEIRILLIVGNLALLRSPYSTILGHRLLLFDVGGVIAAAGMFGMALLTTARHAAQLYHEERLP